MAINETEGFSPPDDDGVCGECGVRVEDHGDACDPATLHGAELSAAAERAFDMAHDDGPDDDMVAGSW